MAKYSEEFKLKIVKEDLEGNVGYSKNWAMKDLL